MKSRLKTAPVALSLLLSASTAQAAGAELHQLGSLDDLVSQFNQDQGTPRVVLLLSPT